jgi:hypothetical protein
MMKNMNNILNLLTANNVLFIYDIKHFNMNNIRRHRSPSRRTAPRPPAKPKVISPPKQPKPIVIGPPKQPKPTPQIIVSPTKTRQPKLPQIFNPQDFIRQNSVRNSYDILVIKKFIGKKILIPCKDLLLTDKIKDDAKDVKNMLMSNDVLDQSRPAVQPSANQSRPAAASRITMHVVCINGIMHIIGGMHNYIAINTISYKDIETNEKIRNVDIKLVQLPKVSNQEIRQLIEYLM